MLTKTRRALPALLAAGALLAPLMPSDAQAIQVGFDCISFNSATDCSIGEAQLVVEVTDLGGNQVLFDFSNLGPAASSITHVPAAPQ